MELKRIPSKAGCLGCIYEKAETCPADEGNGETHFQACTSAEGESMIFVPADAEIRDNPGFISQN